MPTNLLIADQARAQLDAQVGDPPHGLLITGRGGMGKRFVAESWTNLVADRSNISVIEPDEKNTITIETIRELYRQTHSKRESRQVVIIDHAEAMGPEAQNALLKLLEEPNANVSFVLTAPTTDILLPTIVSRVQTVDLPPLARQSIETYIKKNHSLDAKTMAQILFVADGRPAMLTKLLNDPEALKHHTTVMQQAKLLLGSPAYERLTTVQELAKDRQASIETLEAMGHMIHAQLLLGAQPKLVDLADRLELCLSRLAQNGNLRAQLTALFAD